MKYNNNEIVSIGDQIKLWNGCFGEVVCSLDTNEFGVDFPEKEWSYLKSGILVKTQANDLVHLITSTEDMELMRRK